MNQNTTGIPHPRWISTNVQYELTNFGYGQVDGPVAFFNTALTTFDNNGQTKRVTVYYTEVSASITRRFNN